MAVRLTLQRAFLGTIAIALLVGIVPAGVALDRRLVAALVANARSDLEMAPTVLADRTSSRGDMLRMHAQEFARTPGLARALTDMDTSAVRRLAELAQPRLGGEPIVVAPDGRNLIGPPAQDALLAQARRGDSPVATAVEAGAVYHVALAPVADRDGNALAGIAGVAEPLDARSIDAIARLTSSDVTVVVGPRDSVVVSTLEPEIAESLREVARASLSSEGAREYKVGSRVLFAVSTSLDSSAHIVFSRFRDSELAIVPVLHRVAVASAVVALAVALVLGAVIARRVTRPARELSAAAEAMARGAFDAPLPTPRIAELSSVAEQFGEMRRALARQMSELRSANDALEDRNARLVTLQADLMQRDRLAATGRLVANLAHEIRNPVANLRNLLELVRRRVADDPSSVSYVELAIDELLRMHELAEQMLDLNRPRDPTAQRCDPLAVASDVARLATAGAEADDWQMEVDGDPGLSAAMAPDALKQVLLNLVQNAREAMAGGNTSHPKVSVTARAMVDGVEISVRDNGPGVPRELRTRIFDPFFTTKGAVDGVGLGLFVAEGLVRSAGGRLTVHDATDEGGGARFVVELPHATPMEPPSRTQGARAAHR